MNGAMLGGAARHAYQLLFLVFLWERLPDNTPAGLGKQGRAKRRRSSILGRVSSKWRN
jgi:hypothetical protein